MQVIVPQRAVPGGFAVTAHLGSANDEDDDYDDDDDAAAADDDGGDAAAAADDDDDDDDDSRVCVSPNRLPIPRDHAVSAKPAL